MAFPWERPEDPRPNGNGHKRASAAFQGGVTGSSARGPVNTAPQPSLTALPQRKVVDGVAGLEVKIVDQHQQPISWGQALRLLEKPGAQGQVLRDLLTGVLTKCQFRAFFWECCPVTPGGSFEFVLLDAPELVRRRPSPEAFRSHFPKSVQPQQLIVSFLNLGRDAQLLAPAPVGSQSFEGYQHLAAFLRSGQVSAHQKDALWQKLGQITLQCLDAFPGPWWIGTDGREVPWLHVRLDSSPKYVKWPPYMQEDLRFHQRTLEIESETGLHAEKLPPSSGAPERHPGVKSAEAQGTDPALVEEPGRLKPQRAASIGRATRRGTTDCFGWGL